MKKFLLVAAVFSASAFGIAAAMNSAQDLRNEGSYQNYDKGRSGDSGVRAMDISGHIYSNADLTNKLYKKNPNGDSRAEGVNVYQFLNWKQARRQAYWETDGDRKSYKKAFGYIIPRTELKKLRTVDLIRRESDLNGEVSGREKLLRMYR
ncbi:hypothetical protein HN954_00410 [bacterium]|jgi:hypothetical protein|nr:hypothetical protein [bacterium]MBT6832095.1 hypothetical protein [bacterium]MBT6995876.1 hypothetical protein [bacterium]MBT7772599.1 hypothetical protein [bacterium]